MLDGRQHGDDGRLLEGEGDVGEEQRPKHRTVPSPSPTITQSQRSISNVEGLAPNLQEQPHHDRYDNEEDGRRQRTPPTDAAE